MAAQSPELFRQFVGELQLQFPQAHFEEMEPFAGADFSVRIRIPLDDVEEVLDASAALSYDWYLKYKVSILASVSGTGPVSVKA